MPIALCSDIGTACSAVHNRIVVVKHILNPAEIVQVPHTVIRFSVLAVTSENVLCHTLFKNRLITGCINAGNIFYVGGGAVGNGIESVPFLTARILRGSLNEVNKSGVRSVLVSTGCFSTTT